MHVQQGMNYEFIDDPSAAGPDRLIFLCSAVALGAMAEAPPIVIRTAAPAPCIN